MKGSSKKARRTSKPEQLPEHPVHRGIRNGLTRRAFKHRYAWKEDLCAIREREAKGHEKRTRTQKRRSR